MGVGVGGDRESRDSGGGKGAPNPTRPGHPLPLLPTLPNPPSPRSLLYPQVGVKKAASAQQGTARDTCHPTLQRGLPESWRVDLEFSLVSRLFQSI